jgi:hypothetical protein
LGSFQLAKTPLGKNQFSSAHKLPLGKLDPRILKVSINSGKGMCLHDATYTKTAANPEQGKTIDLNITSTVVTDKSGNGNHPTLSNVSLLDGEMQFNGSTSYALLGQSASFETSSISFRIVFKVDELGRTERLVCKWGAGGYSFTIASDYLSITVYKSDWSANAYVGYSPKIEIGKKYDFVVTLERYVGSEFGKITMYLDGVYFGTTEIPFSFVTNSGNLYLGRRADDQTQNLNGSIYAFRMYDYALSPAEVKALSDGRSALYPSQDSLAFAQTQTSVKDLQWFVRNPTSTIEVAPTVLSNDYSDGYWTIDQAGSGTVAILTPTSSSEIQYNGYNTTKFVLSSGTYQWTMLKHVYGVQANWSAQDIFSFYVYGSNSGKTLKVWIDTNGYTSLNTLDLVDNFTGWKRITQLLRGTWSAVSGTPDWSKVDRVRLEGSYTAQPLTLYFYRFIVDVCPSFPVKKLEISGLFLENQLEESPVAGDVLEITDDLDTPWDYWSYWENGSGSRGIVISSDAVNKIKGSTCLNVVFSNRGAATATLFHAYGSPQNWSAYDFLTIRVWGSNSSDNIVLSLTNGSWTNTLRLHIYPIWQGWKTMQVPLRSFEVVAGTYANAIAGVERVQIDNWNDTHNANIKIDRMVLQKGRWAYVEVGVPDALYTFQNYLSANAVSYEWLYWILYTWNGSGYQNASTFDVGNGANHYCSSNQFRFLDTSVLKTLYGENQNWESLLSFAHMRHGLKGEIKAKVSALESNTPSITYNGVGGCKKRIGFAVKMPPADYLASSTTSISQSKLKLEVYSV